MNYEAFLELVRKRRSTRRFKPDPVPDDFIDKIIEAARWAPSGANSQPWEFVVVKKQELKDSIVKLEEEYRVLAYRVELTREPQQRYPTFTKPPRELPGFAVAPVFIIMCGDPRTKDAYPLSALLTRGQSNLISGMASACLYMHLAAAALGLGSQWVSATGDPYIQSLIKELLGIPAELEIYDTMVVGYPASEPGPRMVRAREEIVHYDHYDRAKFRTDAEMKEFILAARGVKRKP